jgi:hypothetical protein
MIQKATAAFISGPICLMGHNPGMKIEAKEFYYRNLGKSK